MKSNFNHYSFSMKHNLDRAAWEAHRLLYNTTLGRFVIGLMDCPKGNSASFLMESSQSSSPRRQISLYYTPYCQLCHCVLAELLHEINSILHDIQILQFQHMNYWMQHPFIAVALGEQYNKSQDALIKPLLMPEMII